MNQNINFYALMRKKSRWSVWLDVRRIQVFAMVFVGVLVLIFIFNVRKARFYSAEHQRVMAQLAIETSEAKKFSVFAGEHDFKKMFLLSDLLSDGASAYVMPWVMEAVSASSVNGLWVTSINISMTDGTVLLTGNTLDADHVQIFLNKIKQQTVFQDTDFRLNELKDINSVRAGNQSVLAFQIVGVGR